MLSNNRQRSSIQSVVLMLIGTRQRRCSAHQLFGIRELNSYKAISVTIMEKEGFTSLALQHAMVKAAGDMNARFSRHVNHYIMTILVTQLIKPDPFQLSSQVDLEHR